MKFMKLQNLKIWVWSPSARRVWIEIVMLRMLLAVCQGHPPRGGCGLKYSENVPYHRNIPSPSARRVWIEMQNVAITPHNVVVTLREEGVD